jgi:hypothetical protein
MGPGGGNASGAFSFHEPKSKPLGDPDFLSVPFIFIRGARIFRRIRGLSTQDRCMQALIVLSCMTPLTGALQYGHDTSHVYLKECTR